MGTDDGLPEPTDPEFGEDADQGWSLDREGAETAAQQAARRHDPTGVDLARAIAAQAGAASQGVRRRRRKPKRTGGVEHTYTNDRDPQLLGSALDSVMAAKGWLTQVNVHMLLANWPKLVGQVNADHSSPESYDGEVLTVRAESTTWATQLRLFAPQLVALLNAELGDGAVTRVVVKGPDAPSWKHGRRSVPGRGPRDTYG
ncbi:DUF721 domain-containing protein [Granulicoccus phenolivorans]|uniref:DUF721 domain-containing protein n=1 Tax=Granulicoccus phenolivorans TaxID=266854 RepID=UPI0004109CAF|nr:DciA family protein [Granulicoccus phenolivorans]